MKECSKSIQRRQSDPSFIRKYFVGDGLDVGGKPDPLVLYQELFPLIKSLRTWDREDGDGQFLDGLPDNSLDFIHSSHCLEHLIDPELGLKNWFRVIREGGYLIVTVPDEDMYEQGQFPSTFNLDHKCTFTIWKEKSWSKNSKNLIDLVLSLGFQAELIKLERLIGSYRFDLPRFDQTLTPVGECGIEFIIRKRFSEEAQNGGAHFQVYRQPTAEIRRQLNQYGNDLKILKEFNKNSPPFLDDSEI